MEEVKKSKVKKFWLEWIKPLLVVAIITGVFRSAIADWYVVPTGSMKPTIMEGDRVFVNKLAYDLRIPFTGAQVSHFKDPQRGDVVVLYSPFDGKRLVKRVIGIPGDTIEMRESRLFVNGKLAEYEPINPNVMNDFPQKIRAEYDFFIEQLGKSSHPVMITPFKSSIRNFYALYVPEGHYFVMGDNRDDSFDSRMFGFVRRDRVVGKATAVVLSFNPDEHYYPRWHRFFTRLP
jgi:signal peptidase I